MAQHVITPLHACSFQLNHDEYQKRYEELAADGYRIVQVDGYRSDSLLLYGGIWVRDNAAGLTSARHGLTSSEYEKAYDDLGGRGYRLDSVAGLSTLSGATSATFAGVWTDGTFRDYRTIRDMTESLYQQRMNELHQQGFRVIYVSGYARANSATFVAIRCSHERSQKERHNLSPGDYESMLVDLEKENLRINHVSAYEVGGKTLFAGIWIREADYDPIETHGESTESFKSFCDKSIKNDQRMICMSGYRQSGQDRYAGIWVRQSRTWLVHGRADSSLGAFDGEVEKLMKKPATVKSDSIPGVSLALARNGELILAKGYSWITEGETPVEPTSLFRLASLSKPLTAAAIMVLAEQGKLTYNPNASDAFNGLGRILPDKIFDLIDMPGLIGDRRVKEITVEHLLHHVGGWDKEKTKIDPMRSDRTIATDLNMPLPITCEAIIEWANKLTLDFSPGEYLGDEGFAYSNYGYMLLGQIIETVSGMPYEQFVQQYVLAPLGIHRMRLGRTLLENRAPGEVLYHSDDFSLHRSVTSDSPKHVMLQYGGSRNTENQAAHGGWLASAVDLVRFASAFDDPASCPILSKNSVEKLFGRHPYVKPPDNSYYYGCGWYIESIKQWQYHGGGFEGTATCMARWKYKGDQFCGAILFNADDDDTDQFEFLRNTAKLITSWPTTGFWGDYF